MLEINTILKELGLIDNEIAIYLALLKLGTAPASRIGHQAEIPRSTAKFTCEQLRKKQIINSIQKGNMVIYSIDSPEKLFYILKQQKQNIELQEQKLNQIMPALKSMINPHIIMPKIQFYEGREGYALTYEHILSVLQPGDEMVSFVKVDTNSMQAHQRVKEIAFNFVQARINKKVRIRLLTLNNEYGKMIQKKDSVSLRKTKIVDAPGLDFQMGEIMIYKDYIWSFSIENDVFFSYILCSPSLSKMNQALFEIAWGKTK
jgi:predicted DNA-binding transcriptional regulator